MTEPREVQRQRETEAELMRAEEPLEDLEVDEELAAKVAGGDGATESVSFNFGHVQN